MPTHAITNNLSGILLNLAGEKIFHAWYSKTVYGQLYSEWIWLLCKSFMESESGCSMRRDGNCCSVNNGYGDWSISHGYVLNIKR
jgi:hypothetical protein